jgi:hypothetical protein
MLAAPAAARAQFIVTTGNPTFEAWGRQSAETDILSGLAWSGAYGPDALPSLARLTVLESIAMLETARADLFASLTGNQLEEEIGALWDNAELFYESSFSAADDTESYARSQLLLVDMGTAFGQLESSLGELPGASPRAAARLRHVSSLLAATRIAMEATAASVPQQIPLAPDRTRGVVQLDEQVGPLTQDLLDLIREADSFNRMQSGHPSSLWDLRGLLELIQGFDRMLKLRAPERDLMDAFRPARRVMQRVDSEFSRVRWPARVDELRRAVRGRIDGMADLLGLPRSIAVGRTVVTRSRPDRELLAMIDRTIIALDQSRPGRDEPLASTREGSELPDAARRPRVGLLALRQRALAGDSPGRLLASLRDLDFQSGQELERALASVRVSRGTEHVIAGAGAAPTEALAKLRELLTQRQKQ